MVTDLNVKCKAIKFLKDNVVENVGNLGIHFLEIPTKNKQANKQKMHNSWKKLTIWTSLKLKISTLQKNTDKRMKSHIQGENIWKNTHLIKNVFRQRTLKTQQ